MTCGASNRRHWYGALGSSVCALGRRRLRAESGRAGVDRRSERSLKRRGRVSEAGKPGKSGRKRLGALRFRLTRGETSKANERSRRFSKALKENNHLHARGQMNGNYGFTGGVWVSDRLIGLRRQSMCGSIWCWLREIPAASAPFVDDVGFFLRDHAEFALRLGKRGFGVEPLLGLGALGKDFTHFGGAEHAREDAAVEDGGRHRANSFWMR